MCFLRLSFVWLKKTMAVYFSEGGFNFIITEMLRKRNIVTILILLAICNTCVGFVIWYRTLTSMRQTSYKSEKNIQPFSGYQQPLFMPVVIVAYMRTGSTLTGNIIQEDPSVFYVFEPLHHLIYQYKFEKMQKYPDIRFFADRPMMMIKEDVERLYRAWFTCDMEYILSETNRYTRGFLKIGHKTNLLLRCLENASNIVHQLNKMQCTDMLQKVCLESKRRVFKTIRTPLSWLKDLMEEFPSMKIVHLIRDPRAVLVSQQRFGECSRKNHGGMAGCSKYLCSSLEDDLTTSQMFSILYPGRIFTLKYEDLVLRPTTKVQELYEFLDLNFTDEIRKYIVNITMSGNNSTSVLDSVRPDSQAMIDKWQTYINGDTLETVQTLCKYVMEKLSYHHFIKPV